MLPSRICRCLTEKLFASQQCCRWKNFWHLIAFLIKKKHLWNTEFNGRWLDGLTAVFMSSTRWKLNWHFYAHSLGQMLGRTRCCSCFLPASPTTEWNIKHSQWSHWKLLPLPPEGLEDVHNYGSTKSYSCWLVLGLARSCLTSSTCGNIPRVRTVTSKAICSKQTGDTLKDKNIFSKSGTSNCLCLEESLCFFPFH